MHHHHHPQQQQNPMDPQPFYIAHDAHQQQQQPRRTWGQPQPISFATTGGPEPYSSQRRQQWGGVRGPGYGGGYNDPYSSPQQQQYEGPNYGLPYDRYGQQPPPGPPMHGQPYGGYGGQPPMQPPPVAMSPYGAAQPPSAYMQSPPMHQVAPPPAPAAPFRLHDTSGTSTPLSRTTSASAAGFNSVAGAGSVTSPIRRASEGPLYNAGDPSRQQQQPDLARQSSRESVMSPGGRRLHSSVPAPREDDMAPQNLSFIETEKEEKAADSGDGTSDEKDGGRESRSLTPVSAGDPLKRLPERLSQLNISSGSKTYRVHSTSQSEKETSPSPTRNTRPTISSTFKQSRRSGSAEPGAGMASGPSSLRSNSGAGLQLTEEEAETLAAMKTERLKDDADASKGFVISFDDEPPKKAKPPALKARRPSKKFSASASGHDLNSDGSSSSRKENVPPELMICIDMNMGSDEGANGSGGGTGSSGHNASGGGSSSSAAASPSRRGKYVSSTAIRHSPTRSSDWKSYEQQSSLGSSHMGQPANDPDEVTNQ